MYCSVTHLRLSSFASSSMLSHIFISASVINFCLFLIPIVNKTLFAAFFPQKLLAQIMLHCAHLLSSEYISYNLSNIIVVKVVVN